MAAKRRAIKFRLRQVKQNLMFSGSSVTFVSGMRKHGILVRDRSIDFGCEDCVQVTLGTLEQTEQLLLAVRQAVEEPQIEKDRLNKMTNLVQDPTAIPLTCARAAKRIALALLVTLLPVIAATRSAQAKHYTFSTIYDGFGGTNGADPVSPLVRDSSGNLYGVTLQGGASGYGTVFKVDTQGNETVLWGFTGGADGATPVTGLRLVGSDLYGTASAGGPPGRGTVFAVSTTGTLVATYSFTGGADGASPFASLTSHEGAFYGTTNAGGDSTCQCGSVFKVTKVGTHFTETTLHDFTSTGGDGNVPFGGVVFDAAGNMYGTTSSGGAYGKGTVFKIDTTNTETVLYSFTGIGADGSTPYGTLTLGTSGNLYGTTAYGGTSGYGTVFTINDGTLAESTLYSFTNGSDGGKPLTVKLLLSGTTLYGTTSSGGASGNGTVFMVTTKGTETVLYSFTNGTDGSNPWAGVIRDTAGNLYGAASSGGANGWGTVWKLARLKTIYSNLGSKTDTYSDKAEGAAWIFGPNGGRGGPQWIAEPFTPKANATITQIQVAIQYYSGPNGFNLVLAADAKGLPGKSLHSWDLTNLPYWPSCCELDTATYAKGVKVEKGKQYWVVAKTDSKSEDSFVEWDCNWKNTQGNQGIYQGAGWAIRSYCFSAFAVRGK
jgi:uncharacterized repeat protein (TIGR03803 family)